MCVYYIFWFCLFDKVVNKLVVEELGLSNDFFFFLIYVIVEILLNEYIMLFIIDEINVWFIGIKNMMNDYIMYYLV